MDINGILSCDSEKFFVRVPTWWSNYECSCLLVAPTSMLFVYNSILALYVKRQSLLFYSAVVAQCNFSLLSVLAYALVGGSVEYIHVFQGASDFAQSVILPPFLVTIYAFVADFRSFSVSRSAQLDFLGRTRPTVAAVVQTAKNTPL